jgi:hypothetical protein
MLSIKTVIIDIILLFLLPGIPVAKWCKIADKEKLLFRMTINISYYAGVAAMIGILFIVF